MTVAGQEPLYFFLNDNEVTGWYYGSHRHFRLRPYFPPYKNGWAIPEMFTVCVTLIEKTGVDPAVIIQ